MIAADSNLVIRHLTQDDAKQAEQVRVLFDDAEARREPVFLSHIVLCEVCWVLNGGYGFEKPQLVIALQALLDDGGFSIQERPLVEDALAHYRRHAGQFSDYLIGVVGRHYDCTTTYTFDKAVAKTHDFTLLK